MPRKRKGKELELTPKEELFVEAYCTNGFDRIKACKDAGLATASRNYGATAAGLLRRPAVVNAISEKLDKKRTQFFITELDILEGLYKEATLGNNDGGTQQGRIAAWTQLGKYYGTFDSKVKELQKKASGTGTTINIMNYNVPRDEVSKYSPGEDGEEGEKDITPTEEEILAIEADIKAADKAGRKIREIRVLDYKEEE